MATRTPVLLWDRKAHEAELGELGDELVGKATAQVQFRRDGLDALPCERSNRVADELLLGSEVEVHGARIVAAR